MLDENLIVCDEGILVLFISDKSCSVMKNDVFIYFFKVWFIFLKRIFKSLGVICVKYILEYWSKLFIVYVVLWDRMIWKIKL